MNQVERLGQATEEQFAGATVLIDPPEDPSGPWWMDVYWQGRHAVVEWRPRRGFGLSGAEGEFGEGPASVVRTYDEALERLGALLSAPPSAQTEGDSALMPLRALREHLRLTQGELGTRLGVRQGAVSKLERRGDMHVSTLRRLIEALGGELEIGARFPDGRYQLLVGEEGGTETA